VERRFLHVFEGKAKLVKLAGIDFWRVEVDGFLPINALRLDRCIRAG
jgi:hypothetical protein